MNPGPILIIKNTFQKLCLALLFLALIKYENIFTFLQSYQKPKKNLYYIVLVA
jgi:hypothetical protein